MSTCDSDVNKNDKNEQDEETNDTKEQDAKQPEIDRWTIVAAYQCRMSCPSTLYDKMEESLYNIIAVYLYIPPPLPELNIKDVIPEDAEVINELKSLASGHTRMKSAVFDLAGRLPFGGETNFQVASAMMQHIKDTEDDVHLEGNTQDLSLEEYLETLSNDTRAENADSDS